MLRPAIEPLSPSNAMSPGASARFPRTLIALSDGLSTACWARSTMRPATLLQGWTGRLGQSAVAVACGGDADDAGDDGWHVHLIGRESGVNPQRVTQNQFALPPHTAEPGLAVKFGEADLRAIDGEPRPRAQRKRRWAPQGRHISDRKHGGAVPLQADVGQSNLSVRPRLKPRTG